MGQGKPTGDNKGNDPRETVLGILLAAAAALLCACIDYLTKEEN